jgi:hypothetical protein
MCLFHDLERGAGHRADDPEWASRADDSARATLDSLLRVESQAGVRVTYNIVGEIFKEVRADIESAGHAIAFHSYDHADGDHQLERCRELDYRVKGYRPPRSLLGPDTADERLAYHNFEWIASGRRSLRTDTPVLRRRLVRLPVLFDDYPLYTGQFGYEEWERRVLESVDRQPFTAIGLHDCYAHLWLDRYPELLAKLSSRAELRTLDQVSADAIIGTAA